MQIPKGLGIDRALRSRNSFFLLNKDMGGVDKVQMAVGIYALSRFVQASGKTDDKLDARKAMRLWASSARKGSSDGLRGTG